MPNSIYSSITKAARSGHAAAQARLSACGYITPGGKFEVDAISAGEGNGWLFGPEVLQASLPLWEGVACYVDHGGWQEGRSVRDLAGVFQNPRWCAESRSVRLDLATLGPSGPLLEALGREILDEERGRPKVGFSADILFTAKGRQVQQILRVLSLDLVSSPARGGAFVRALNSLQTNPFTIGDPNMTEPTSTQLEATPNPQSEGALQAAQLQLCASLLEAGLSASHLPQAMQDHLRRRFSGRAFQAAELNAAVEDARCLVSDLTGPSAVAGPTGRVQAMFSSEDQLQAAVDDLLDAPREPAATGLKTARLSGIKELYMLLTGDRELYGGYYGDRVQLATTATFPGLVKNALNKIVANQWSLLGAAGYDWWQRVVHVEHCDTLNDVTGVLVGTVGELPVVAEGDPYTELKVGDSPETASFVKYGGYIPLTLELIDRDDTRKLRVYPRELAKAGLRRISSLVAGVFTAQSGVGPDMADGEPLFNNTAVTSAGGHANLLTSALSSSAWETVKQAMYKQPLLVQNAETLYGSGPRQALKPRYLLVPAELELAARKILYGEWENAANIHADNLQRQLSGDVVVVPDWTDPNDWAAAADPRLSPGIVVGERFGLLPEIFLAGDELSPAVFTNDQHRIKVRHFLAVLVQDFRPLHKCNV